MREIKFRAWNKVFDVMQYFDDMSFDDEYMTLAVYYNMAPHCKNCSEHDSCAAHWRLPGAYSRDKAGKYMPNYSHENANLVMQYTGLKDKNGVEVYEGDVITNPYYYNDDMEHLQGVVEFGDCEVASGEYNAYGYYLKTNGADYTELLKPSLAADTEVVGNIYQNPELLNKK